MTADLTPFGFTPTESLVYTTLLRLGPTTGYAVARAARHGPGGSFGSFGPRFARVNTSRRSGDQRSVRQPGRGQSRATVGRPRRASGRRDNGQRVVAAHAARLAPRG